MDDVVLALPSWGGERAAFLAGEEHLERMGCIRSALTAFAAGVGLDVIDLASLLCPDGPGGACNDLRENDGTHIDPEDAPGTLDWVLDAVT